MANEELQPYAAVNAVTIFRHLRTEDRPVVNVTKFQARFRARLACSFEWGDVLRERHTGSAAKLLATKTNLDGPLCTLQMLAVSS